MSQNKNLSGCITHTDTSCLDTRRKRNYRENNIGFLIIYNILYGKHFETIINNNNNIIIGIKVNVTM